MEIQWMNLNRPGIDGRSGHIIYIICRQCYERFETKDYNVLVPNHQHDPNKLVIWYVPNNVTGVRHSKPVRECPKCGAPLNFIEYTIKKKPGKIEPYLAKVVDRSLPLSHKALVTALDVIKGKKLEDVGNIHGVTGTWDRHQTLHVFKRLLPTNWNKLKKETKTQDPTVRDDRKYKTELIKKIAEEILK